MLLHEPSDVFLVRIVVEVLLPLQSGRVEHLRPPASAGHLLLDFLISVGESGNLASLPVEVALVEGILHGDKEEEAVRDERPLVNVSPHGRVLCIHHY